MRQEGLTFAFAPHNLGGKIISLLAVFLDQLCSLQVRYRQVRAWSAPVIRGLLTEKALYLLKQCLLRVSISCAFVFEDNASRFTRVTNSLRVGSRC